ncbi:zinc finger and SCAN domain-containing protein 12-like isoform X18 [Venturia canescens]|uniref:zinc finger and SCAN domain-containing protein 12-like isoform X18 n=1 Tax=Venturia canescens TaxID=32260 RepID=UPI001C9D4C66|nr:zinc finger and SCAN domain-containing protein 12-like isoform X18 [Venturia canescens]
MSSLDYLDLCRLCLVKDRVSVPIFEGEGDVRQIFLKIAACLPVKVGREDKLPKKICDDCVYKVELFYQFWNTTANAEKQLLQWLGEVSMDDKQGYVTGAHDPSMMKPGQNTGENRLDGSSVMQQVNEHTNNMGMGMMDGMGIGMPMMIPNSGQQPQQQQMTSVPMDTGGNAVQNVQPVPGPSAQIGQQKINAPTNEDEDEDESEEEDNSDDECDGDDGLPVKEESEDEPNRTIEPTTFVNVSLACDEAGPSGLQQQKIGEMPEMVMPPTDGDPKSGSANEIEKKRLSAYFHVVVKSAEREMPLENSDPLRGERQVDEEIPGELRATKNKGKSCSELTTEKEECAEATEDLAKKEKQVNLEEESLRRENETREMWEERTKDFYKCGVCSKLFRSKNLYEGHLVAHSDARPHECDICHKTFKRTNTLAVHRRIHTHERNFVCDVCGRAFVQASQLATHQRRHFEKYTCFCDICGKGFFTNAERHGHMNMKHAANEHVCHSCGKTFPNNHTLARHAKIHEPNFRPVKHQCEICGKVFAYKNSLVVHVKSHTGENKYACDLCEKIVSSKGSLQDHLRLHGGEKSLVCDVCGKAFHKRTTLVVHKRTHTGEKPYNCDTCDTVNFSLPKSCLQW